MDFYSACLSGDVDRVAAMVKKHNVDVNQIGPNGKKTAFQVACSFPNRSEVILLLLSCPRVDVNKTVSKILVYVT